MKLVKFKNLESKSYVIITERMFNRYAILFIVNQKSVPYIRCLTLSYKNAPQATETFKEVIEPNKGSFAL